MKPEIELIIQNLKKREAQIIANRGAKVSLNEKLADMNLSMAQMVQLLKGAK